MSNTLQTQDPFALPLDLTISRSRVSVFNQSVAEGAPVIEQEALGFKPPEQDFKVYGGARELFNLVTAGTPQVMIHGPAETGKTFICLNLINYLCWKYPGVQGSMVRKVGADLWSSIIPDFETIIQMKDGECPSGITKYGGQKPEFYLYPNGSKIWVGGLDKPGKVLSAQRDFVYTNQTEQFELTDWQTISTRTTGRAGVLKPGRLIGDCNPGPSTHWILKLAEAGTLRMVKSLHKDNPTLFDPETGEITEQGKRSIGQLQGLTGVLHKRLYLGMWVAAEGTVYEPFEVIDKPYSPIRRYIAGVDWGWTNPGGFQIWGVDGDNRMYRVEEQYRTKVHVTSQVPTDDTWTTRLLEAHKKYKLEAVLCDPSEPSFIEAFQSAGLPAQAAENAIIPGIQLVEGRQKVQDDGFPRIALLRGTRPEADPFLVEEHKPTCFEEEVEVYVYPKDKVGRTNKKENPVDKHNHACDMCRYATAYVDGLGENDFMFGQT